MCDMDNVYLMTINKIVVFDDRVVLHTDWSPPDSDEDYLTLSFYTTNGEAYVKEVFPNVKNVQIIDDMDY